MYGQTLNQPNADLTVGEVHVVASSEYNNTVSHNYFNSGNYCSDI